MNDLIINGVDHAKFDLEWAKHGGCCIFDDSTDVYKQLILGKQVEERFIGARFFFRDHWVKLFCYFENYPTRMATPAECEAAGIEYIEYHGWRPIGTAPLDTLVIVETDQKKVGCAIFESRNESEHFGLGSFASRYRNWMPMPQPPKDE